jgi:chorismate-pyruvate lyase
MLCASDKINVRTVLLKSHDEPFVAVEKSPAATAMMVRETIYNV